MKTRATAYTLGPWVAKNTADCYRISASGICVADTYYDCSGNEEANARLIAAAPELLEALKKIAFNNSIDRDGWTADEAFDHSRSLALLAIAKAENC